VGQGMEGVRNIGRENAREGGREGIEGGDGRRVGRREGEGKGRKEQTDRYRQTDTDSVKQVSGRRKREPKPTCARPEHRSQCACTHNHARALGVSPREDLLAASSVLHAYSGVCAHGVHACMRAACVRARTQRGEELELSAVVLVWCRQ